MLVPCPECRKPVSDSAPTCPQCGHPIAGPLPPAKPAHGQSPCKKCGGPLDERSIIEIRSGPGEVLLYLGCVGTVFGLLLHAPSALIGLLMVIAGAVWKTRVRVFTCPRCPGGARYVPME